LSGKVILSIYNAGKPFGDRGFASDLTFAMLSKTSNLMGRGPIPYS